MITHEEAVRMCEILDQRRAEKKRKAYYDAVSFQVDSIAKTKKRINIRHGIGRKYTAY